MRYLGGKSKLAKKIAKIINCTLRPGQLYLEPFCGSCAVTMLVRARRRVIADANQDLVLMWSALQKGWSPPMGFSEQKYNEFKDSAPSALRGFAGFQCSFAGKWFGGYARYKNDNYASSGRRGLVSAQFRLYRAIFCCADYRSWNPTDAVIYCDPPYQGKTSYKGVRAFDSDLFWEQVREWSSRNIVYVSEVEAPEDFQTVMDVSIRTGLRDSDEKNTRRERLFVSRN